MASTYYWVIVLQTGSHTVVNLLHHNILSLQYPIVKSSPYSHPETFILFSLCNISLKYLKKLHIYIKTISRIIIFAK